MSDFENTAGDDFFGKSNIGAYYEKYAAFLCNYAYNYLNEREAAEDIVQDVFQRIIEKNVRFTNEETVKNYLLNAVRNACVNYLKKLHPITYTADLINYQVIDEEFDDYDEQTYERLREELFNLPPQTQKIIVAIFYRNLKYQEVADELNISINTVKSLLKSGLKTLRKAFGDDTELILLFWGLRKRPLPPTPDN